MPILSTTSTTLVSGLHGYILVLQMFLWTTPRGRKAFKLTPEYAEASRVLAANQGLYNGFLAAGLAWGLAHPVPEVGMQIRLFFQGCVFVAGLFGAATASPRIFFIQSVPALLAGAATYFDL